MIPLGPILGVALVGSIGWGMWYMEDRAHDKTISEAAEKIAIAQTNAANLEQALRDSESSINELRISQAVAAERRKALDEDYARIQKNLADEQEKHNNYRSRWINAATKKPGLVGRVINRAWTNGMLKLEAATCRADCDEDGDTENIPGATETPKPDSETQL